ncbi:MAG: hypothetical protein K8L97_13680 [Anaerolineae bacterium]|nr:hypothetical protein [Anaerolineae bacterium]
MSNWYLDTTLQGLRNFLRMERDSSKRAYLETLIDKLRKGIRHAEEKERDAKMIGVRNPSFDGDMVGYPEDDFDD